MIESPDATRNSRAVYESALIARNSRSRKPGWSIVDVWLFQRQAFEQLLLQQVAHDAVLGEDQGAVAFLQNLFEHLDQSFALGTATVQFAIVFQELRRVVADLF